MSHIVYFKLFFFFHKKRNIEQNIYQLEQKLKITYCQFINKTFHITCIGQIYDKEYSDKQNRKNEVPTSFEFYSKSSSNSL